MTTTANRPAALLTSAVAALAIGATALPTAASANVRRDARVVRVIDGDQVVLTSPNGAHTYRLLGVTAPALTDCFGTKSRNRLRSLLPAGARVKVIARRSGARSVVVLKGGAGVNRLVVESGHAKATLRDGSQLARLLRTAQSNAQDDGAGLWAACEDQPERVVVRKPTKPAPSEETAPETTEETPAPTKPAPTAPSGQKTRLSQSQFQAFVSNSVFTRASNSSNTGGSSNRNDFTFCASGQYGFESESFNNGFTTGVTESGTWKLVELTRRDDLKADQGKLELVTQDSNSSDFDPNSSQEDRTFTVFIASFDDGRVSVGADFAQRSAATTC